MTAKHAPATPLPWFVNGAEGHREIRSDREMTDEQRAFYAEKFRRPFLPGERIEGPISQDDYPYIVHVANAYRELVERVKSRESWLRAVIAAMPDDVKPMYEEIFGAEAASDDALLRSLGEDA